MSRGGVGGDVGEAYLRNGHARKRVGLSFVLGMGMGIGATCCSTVYVSYMFLGIIPHEGYDWLAIPVLSYLVNLLKTCTWYVGRPRFRLARDR